MSIERANLQAEFQDHTSAQLLTTPLPQFLHGRMIMAAVGQNFDASFSTLPLGQTRKLDNGGAPYLQLGDMQHMLSDEIASEAIKVQSDFSQAAEKNRIGHVIRMNRPKFVTSTYSLASRTLTAGAPISTTPINVQSEQVKLEVQRLGGPYSGTQGAVAPYAINAFDTYRSIHNIPAVVELFFAEDFHRFVDAVGVNLLNQGATIYAGSMSTDDSSTSVDDNPFSYDMVLATKLSMDSANIPTFKNGKRLMVLTPKQATDLQKDDQFQRLAKYHEKFNPLFVQSYVGSVSGFDIMQSTTMSTPLNTNSIPIQYGQAFGPGSIGVAPASVPRVVASTNDNYGQDLLAVWLWFCAFGVLDDRYQRSLRSS